MNSIRLFRQIISFFFSACLISMACNTHAASITNIQVYISPDEYSHPVLLQFPWGPGEWVYQGMTVEPIAENMLQDAFGAVAVCQGVQKGKSLIWLRPSLFFNPQVGIYYGTMMANVYDGKGKYINKYAGESKVQGSFFSGRQENITESYRVALGDLITKLKADNALAEIIAADFANGEEYASCSQVPTLPSNLPNSALKK
ncbi:MAG: hypothetical protein RJB20_741 [Pseudomonadota bacterium]|jgi:hypothetical protein